MTDWNRWIDSKQDDERKIAAYVLAWLTKNDCEEETWRECDKLVQLIKDWHFPAHNQK